MKQEIRIIKASVLTGITEMLIGLFMALTGLHQWYFDRFHFFGILGLGLLIYGFWLQYFYKKENGGDVWRIKKSWKEFWQH